MISPKRKKNHRSASAMTSSEGRSGRRNKASGNKGGAVKVPKEIQVRRLKEAFKSADENGEGRVDLEGFRVALRSLELPTTEYSSSMLFTMSLQNEDATEMTYMDFYKVLKKGCENYPGISAQDVIANLVMEFGNTSQGQRARNRDKQAKIARSQHQMQQNVGSSAPMPGGPLPNDGSGHLNVKQDRRAQNKSFGSIPDTSAKNINDSPKQNDLEKRDIASIPGAKTSNQRQSFMGGSQRNMMPNQNYHPEQQQQMFYGGQHMDPRFGNYGANEDHYGQNDGYHLNYPNEIPKKSYHAYSQSMSQIDLRPPHGMQPAHGGHSGHLTRGSIDMGRNSAMLEPRQYLGGYGNEVPTPQNASTRSSLSDNFQRGMNDDTRGSVEEDSDDDDERGSITGINMSLMDQYHGQLTDVADLLGSGSEAHSHSHGGGKGGFLHQRQKSMDLHRVDMSHITNYLRSQDQIVNARLISLEDNIRRQIMASQTLIQAIPIYNKKTIKTWIANETGLLINEFSKKISDSVSEVRGMVENSTENTINQLDHSDTMKNFEISIRRATQVVDKMSKSNSAQYLDLGSSLNEMTEQLSEIRLELQKGGGMSSSNLSVNPTDNNLLDAQFEAIEACVEQSVSDVHLKLTNKFDNLENILLAIAMKSGVAIPEMPDWEGEHAKLASTHLAKIQEQERSLAKKSQDLIKIKKEVELQARKLKEDREKMRKENEQTKMELKKQRMEMQAQLEELENEKKNQVEGATPGGNLSPEEMEALETQKKDLDKQLKELEKKRDDFKKEREEWVNEQDKGLLEIERKSNEYEELKQEFKIEQKKIKAKREQLKKDEKHVEECKNDLEAIFEEIANKRNEVLGREEAVSTREKELRKVESQVQSILKEKKQLSLARKKMEELHSKMGEDLKKKDEEISNWKKQALGNSSTGGSGGADAAALKSEFEKEKASLVEKHNNEKKKLAVAARKKFQQDFQKEIDAAANKVSEDKKLLEKERSKIERERSRLKTMTEDLVKSMSEFENTKGETLAEIRKERESLSREKKKFEELIILAEQSSLNLSMSEVKKSGNNAEEEQGIDELLGDIGGFLESETRE